MMPYIPPRHKLTVLVIDDSPDEADSVAMVLALHGFTTRVAYRGDAALTLAGSEPTDVVLLDLAMPEIDGWALAGLLRDGAKKKRPLLVAVSGYGDETARRRSEDAGIDLHLVKPVDSAVLIGLLSRFERVLDPMQIDSEQDIAAPVARG